MKHLKIILLLATAMFVPLMQGCRKKPDASTNAPQLAPPPAAAAPQPVPVAPVAAQPDPNSTPATAGASTNPASSPAGNVPPAAIPKRVTETKTQPQKLSAPKF